MMVINSINNPKYKMWLKISESKKDRDKENKFLVEGVNFYKNKIDKNQIVSIIIMASKVDNFKDIIEDNNNCYILQDPLFSKISSLSSSQGIIMILKKPATNSLIEFKGNYGVCLDNIQNPSNLGAILRVAEAFNIQNVFLTNNCCDPFSAKCLRGLQNIGILNRITIIDAEGLINFINEQKIQTLTTYINLDHSINLKDFKLESKKQYLSIFGNEGHGLLDIWKQTKPKNVIIKTSNIESLSIISAFSIFNYFIL